MKIKLKKGLRLNIDGQISDFSKTTRILPGEYAITPDDYPGFIPKVEAREGDRVKTGSPLLFDKNQPDLKLVSPVCGTVKQIVRGERRKILRVVVEADRPQTAEFAGFKISKDSSSEEIKTALASSGLLALLRRRPYDTVVRLDDTVRDIFVTAFDLAPLAAPLTVSYDADTLADIQLGVNTLSRLTSGKIYISTDKAIELNGIRGAEITEFEGPYPASNTGVQIANIAPVNKGDVVWALDIRTLAKIGRFAASGQIDPTVTVAVTGPEVVHPQMIETLAGAAIAPLIENNIDNSGRHLRIISGNVFTGTAVDLADGFLRYPYRQITVIAEGDDVDEFMGWASFAPGKMSQSRTFPGHFLGRLFRPDARLNGGRRAMIMSGEFDRVMPMDILPEYLLKAIIGRDIDSMEKLGIYEVAPEDFAAAEYVDTSKMPLQQIVRDGLDYIRKELE